ncbi:hypothetical protein ACFSHT_08940 [Paraburkholderia silviterrae]|uniref:Uncharacterized protein n=1 Tax=Paraburkholderia silviterrae TaxID=2528715 RepID=A0A4R5MDK9_9BURK|nr:hypothetical protein [Paraburkholderia silviterrae]TDG25119.1 hypothetical protein EYW47_04450 [Paraburkholderia silviterrae]
MKPNEWMWPLGVLAFVIVTSVVLRHAPYTSTETATWVQAIASVVAIWWSGSSARRLQRDIQRQKRITRAGAVVEIATAAWNLASHVVTQLPDREAVQQVGRGERHFDYPELQEMERVTVSIPLHDLNTPELVRLVMMLTATVRQLREKVDFMLANHREIDGAGFEEFFKTLGQMRSACLDIRNRMAEQLAAIEHS